MAFSDLEYYRESEDMIVVPSHNGSRSVVFVLFDNTIANITKAVQAGAFGREQARTETWIRDDAWECVHGLVTGKFSQDKERQCRTNS